MDFSLLKWVTPNQLTVGRIVLIPLLLVFIYLADPVSNWIAFAIFLLACGTDYLDGRLARFRDEVSHLGKLLDPIADKMLVSASLVMLVSMDIADVVPTIVILMREFAVSGLRQVAALEGVVIAAEPGAKWKTTLQMTAVAFHLITYKPFSLPLVGIGQVLLWAAAAWTLWTGVTYFREYYKSA
jgi:CDP-diacylglycerol--glycerol-3-phosphate 3-phosphatidyltransferase